jgi:hypothetical protein
MINRHVKRDAKGKHQVAIGTDEPVAAIPEAEWQITAK